MKYKRLYNKEIDAFELYLTDEDSISDEEIKMGIPIYFKSFKLNELLKMVNDRVTLNIEKSQVFPNTAIMSDIFRLSFLKLYSADETFIEE